MMDARAWLRPTLLFAAGSVAGAAHAQATTYDVSFAPTASGTLITLGGGMQPPQFSFSSGTTFGKASDTITGLGTSRIGTQSTTPYYPTSSQTSPSQTTYKNSPANAGGSGYYGITFDSLGTAQTGYFHLTNAGQLIDKVSFRAVSAAPEPDAWALMILGFGGVGTALRHQRRRERARQRLVGAIA